MLRRRASTRFTPGAGSNFGALVVAGLPMLLVVGATTACPTGPGPVEPEPAVETYAFDLPPGFPAPRVPADNPMSDEKVELGRHLFYDVRLSGNETMACATCHEQDKAFTDGKGIAEGSTGEFHSLGSMGLANVGYASTLGWANPILRTLEAQAVIPMFGETPVELGMTGNDAEVLARLQGDETYEMLFDAAFPNYDVEQDEINDHIVNIHHIVQALSSFQRTMISGRSAFDRYVQDGDETALDGLAQYGREIFFSEQADCFHCHGGVLFSDSLTHEGTTFDETPFHNNGLYNLDATGAYPPANQGVFGISSEDADKGRFKAPTLRNIAVTGPYMHDGSLETLTDVLLHYARGGTRTDDGPNAGDGRDNPNKSGFVHGFVMTPEEQFALVAFLESLTDEEFLVDPRFSDPW